MSIALGVSLYVSMIIITYCLAYRWLYKIDEHTGRQFDILMLCFIWPITLTVYVVFLLLCAFSMYVEQFLNILQKIAIMGVKK